MGFDVNILHGSQVNIPHLDLLNPHNTFQDLPMGNMSVLTSCVATSGQTMSVTAACSAVENHWVSAASTVHTLFTISVSSLYGCLLKFIVNWNMTVVTRYWQCYISRQMTESNTIGFFRHVKPYFIAQATIFGALLIVIILSKGLIQCFWGDEWIHQIKNDTASYRF